MDIRMESDIGTERWLACIRSDAVWEDIARRWKALYDPYVPMDTGALKDTVTYGAGEIRHTVPYAGRMYAGGVRYRTGKHPKASAAWDIAAVPTESGALTAYAAERIAEALKQR